MPVASSFSAHQQAAFASFLNEFVGESDRAAVILGASKIEYMLGEVLDKFLLPSPATNDELLEGDSPLGTFSAKIKACHRLGIIDDQFAKQMNIFRKLRNGFAHEVTSNTLSTGAARDRVGALVEPFAQTELYRFLADLVAGRMTRAKSDHGVMFRAVLVLFHLHLMNVTHHLRPVQRQETHTITQLSQLALPESLAGAAEQ